MNNHPPPSTTEEPWLQIVRRQVQSLHFGVVQIVVHNNRVVQIERTEKVRLNDATQGFRPMEGI
jgi:hypothetical protein